MAGSWLSKTFGPTSQQGDIKPLTGVRGVAAFIVMLYHFCNYPPFAQFHTAVLQKGYLCVDLFFVLSGFVIALRYGQRLKGALWRSSYGAFLLARVGRIYPAYFIISLLYYAKWIFNISGLNTEAYRLQDFLANIFLVQSWGLPVRAVLSDSWSVSVELFPYLALPLLVLATLGKSRLRAAATVVISIGLLTVIATSGLGVQGPLDAIGDRVGLLPLLRCLAGFSMGMVAYRVVSAERARRVLGSSAALAVALAAIIGALWLDRTDVFTVVLFPVLVACLYYNAPLSAALFGNKVIHQLGDVSFSLYLLHPFFIGVAGHFLMVYGSRFGAVGPLVFLLIGVAATWAAATASYRFIEVPGRRILRVSFKPRQDQAVAV